MALFKKEPSQKQIEKRERAILEKERELHHYEVLKQAEIDAKKEKIAPEGAYISLKNVDKIYPNHVQAVFDFNIDIKEKEFIVFVGPSGCGKSTTLRMVAGLEEITAGDLFINGEYSNDVQPKDRKIGMVFQSYALFPYMTVYENIAFPLEVLKMKKDEIHDRVTKAAKILQLEEYLNRKPNALSGGQMQRVALGRVIVTNSKIFLMDEPLSNLDAKLRVSMRSEIVKLHKSLNTTTIYVTHDQTEAMTMADRIVVMNKGYVQQIGTPAEIFNNPSNMFVATFVGSPSMNMIQGNLVENKFYITDDFSLDMGEGFADKIRKFYENEIASTNELLKSWADKFLNRQFSNKRYLSIFKGETVNTKELKNYLICLDDAALKSLDINKDELISKLTVIKDKEELKTSLNTVLKDYLLRYHELNNPDIRTHVSNINKYKEVLEGNSIPLILGIRPEHFILTEEVSEETLSLEVSVSELLGSEYFLHFPFKDLDLVAKLPVKKDIASGDKINLNFDMERIHFFDPISTKKMA
jgi:multiple sugar transport system ATP-binding protein